MTTRWAGHGGRTTRVAATVMGLTLLLSACNTGSPPVEASPAAATPRGSTSAPPATTGPATGATVDMEETSTAGEGESPTASSVTTEESGAPEESEVSAHAVDYSTDAGQELQEYEYPDDPEPAGTVSATLCNLDQQFFLGLRAAEDGSPVADDSLRMSVLAVGDLLDTWESLRPHYPEVGAEIDTAHAVRNSWDHALLSLENGEAAEARVHMAEAEEHIGELPETAGPDCESGRVG